MSAGRGSLPADPLFEHAKEAVERVSARFARAGMPFDRAELEQVGWQAVIEMMPRCDPSKGDPVAYFRKIARRAVGKHCSKMLSKVSVGKKYDQAALYQHGTDAGDWNHEGIDPRYEDVVRDKLRDEPEARLLAMEVCVARERFVRSVRKMVGEILGAWSAEERFIVRRITGLDGKRPETARELAARCGYDVRRVYKLHAKLTDEMWGHTGLLLLHLQGGQEDREDREDAKPPGKRRHH